MNVIVIADGAIRCTVHTDEALPAEGYQILARLATAVEEANEELLNLMEPDDEPDERRA